MIRHILYASGVIRNTEGTLIAFYDSIKNLLYVGDKIVSVLDSEHAMEILEQYL